jgi:prevent-host-death family protein
VLVVGSGPAQRLLVLGELSGDLLALAESPSAGLRLVGSAPTSAGGGAGPVYPAQLLAAADDGERVLVSNRGPGTVAVLDARPLRRVAEHPVGALWPRHVARAGDLLLVAGERSDVLVVLRLVDGGTGVRELSRHATGSPTCVAPRP